MHCCRMRTVWMLYPCSYSFRKYNGCEYITRESLLTIHQPLTTNYNARLGKGMSLADKNSLFMCLRSNGGFYQMIRKTLFPIYQNIIQALSFVMRNILIQRMFPFGAAVPRRGNPLKYFTFSFVKRASS
jgi:hypothetical protein